ncbi:DDE_3 domain-containing protein [Trichonephila clavipes]|nr:DDE_3 domain-containing protein [Trichonephila clavipes]
MQHVIEHLLFRIVDSERIHRLVWPARSPDLNPIENVWDALGRQVAGRNYPPTKKNTLIRALTEEWDKLPQQLLDNVVQSMIRVECCITLHGGHIPLIPFFKVPADFYALFHFSVRRSNEHFFLSDVS